MAYVITEKCIDVLDRTCTKECPVDCIYEGDRMLYINPDECIDCGACEPVCPSEAIHYEEELPEDMKHWQADNVLFCIEVLAGRDAPLGKPMGARNTGRIGVDTELVRNRPTK